MGLIDWLSSLLGYQQSNPEFDEARRLIGDFQRENRHHDHWNIALKDSASGQAILSAKPTLQITILHLSMDHEYWRNRQGWVSSAIYDALSRRKLPYTEDDLKQIALTMVRDNSSYYYFAFFVSALEHYLTQNALTPNLREALLALYERTPQWYHDHETRRQNERLEYMLNLSEPGSPVAGEAWANAAQAFLATLEPEPRRLWLAALAHGYALDAGKPSLKWSKQAEAHAAEVGGEAFYPRLREWARIAAEKGGSETWNPRNEDLLKGVLWLVAQDGSPENAPLFGALAEVAYRRVPGGVKAQRGAQPVAGSGTCRPTLAVANARQGASTALDHQ